MFGNTLLGLLIMSICLVVQAVIVANAVRYYKVRRGRQRRDSRVRTIAILIAVMVMLVIGNFFQIAIWGGVFVYLEEFDRLSVALYHSAVNFATLGYGDIVMSESRRALGPLEAINGIVMVGVSTAVLMAVVQDLLATAGRADK